MKRLCQRLSIPQYAAVGLLESLWHLTAKEAPQGDIGKLSNEDIALGLEWDGDPEKLVASLISSKWIDESEKHRLVVHDWHEHADEAVKKKLIRKSLQFLSVSPLSRHKKTDRPAVSLPEPEPVPDPVPTPGAEPAPTAAAVATPSPTPPPPALRPSAGANGEFMLAQELGREIKLAMRAGDIALVAQVIANETPEHGDGLKAKDFIRDRALEARSRGEPVTVFWLQDRKFDRTQAKDVYQQFLEADV